MANNLIVTCGTSQIDAERIAGIGDLRKRQRKPRLEEASYDRLRQDSAKLVHDGYFDAAENEPEFKQLQVILEDNWAERHALVSRSDNPFGAELSTLIMMEAKQRWMPQVDQVTILTSETKPGAWCGAMVQQVLQGQMGVKDAQCRIVPGLRETPADPNGAVGNLARKLLEHLKPRQKNIIVMTGGFKSVIPCLTIFSLVFGAELIYRFENSDKLQNLQARFAEPDDEKVWRKIWKSLDQSDMLAGPNECLSLALERWLENPSQWRLE